MRIKWLNGQQPPELTGSECMAGEVYQINCPQYLGKLLLRVKDGAGTSYKNRFVNLRTGEMHRPSPLARLVHVPFSFFTVGEEE